MTPLSALIRRRICIFSSSTCALCLSLLLGTAMLPHSVLPLAPQAQAANPVVISSYTPFKDYDWLINYVAFYLFFTGTHNAIIQWISTPAGQAFFNEYPALNFLKAGIPSAN